MNDEKWALVEKTLTTMMQQNDIFEAANEIVKFDDFSPFSSPLNLTQVLVLDVLKEYIGDTFDVISWFVYECDYGRSPAKGVVNGEVTLIDSYDKLRRLVESGY